ncbi:MAG: class I SAM-dependent methyltransferase [Myxococcota bacterium]
MGTRKQKSSGSGKSGRKGRNRGRSQARRADRYVLYQKSVQVPEADVSFVRRVFKKRYGRPARLLREDFCGTAIMCCEWVRTHRDNRAWGVDLDPEPLAWGREHNLSGLEPAQRDRVALIEGDVLEAPAPEPVDVTVAFNFSYFIFHERAQLRAYFDHARKTLGPEGVLMLDAYGGADAQRTMTEAREIDGFDYVWDQHKFDPIHHRAVNYIHFEFPDGSELKRAFRYDWRLWGLPELRDLLLEVGFADVQVFWEGTDRETGEGNGVYKAANEALDDPAWIAYVAAYTR